MSIGVLSRTFKSELRGAADLPLLFGCIGEKLRVKTTIYYEQATIISDDNKGYYNPAPTISGKIYNDDLLFVTDGDFFNQCQVGDEVVFRSQDYPTDPEVVDTIVEILNGGLARLSTTRANRLLDGGFIYNNTALKSLAYQYGLGIGGFNSLIDDSEQKYILNNEDALSTLGITPAAAVGDRDWQFKIGELALTGNGASPSPASQSIIIEHEFVVLPPYLAGSYEDMRLGLAPDYFLADNKIRYFSLLDYNKSSVVTGTVNQIEFEGVGQFGWYGKKYNGSKADYSISSLVIERVSDSELIDKLEYEEVEIRFTVTSSGAAISTTDTGFVFGFNYLPEDPAYYQNTGRTVEENFCFDSKRLLPDNISVNGDHFGTDLQVIKTIKAERISSTQVDFTVRILFGSDQIEILKQGDTAQYAMWLIVENIGLAPELSDKCSLLLQVDIIHVQLTTVDLLDATTLFIEHPYDVVAYGKPTLELYPVDDVVANSVYSIDYAGKETDGILLKAVTPQIVLTHATEADIVLDSFRANLDNFPTVGTSPAVQDIAFNQKRPYKIEDGIRKTIAFERAYSMDAGTVKYFVLNFPFMNRWEYWIKIAGLTSIPEDLFDNTVPFGGANHLWNRLANISGWSLKYRTTFEIEQNGKLFEQSFESDITSSYFNSNTDWINCEIDSFDPITGDQIVVGAKNYAYAGADTRIKATFEKGSGDVPDLENVCIVIWAEGFEGGGISEITRISSRYDVEDVSAFRSLDSSNRTVMTKTGSVFTGEALLKFSKIQSYSKLSIYARIYELDPDVEDDGRVTNDYILRVTNDGQTRLILS